MDQRALIDVVCKSGLQKLAGEVSALLGQVLSCSDIQLRLTTKQQLFSNPEREKTILTRMAVTGDREGRCYLLNRITSAAILGGTLIMLPQEVITEQAKAGKLGGELGDAFGEVANIIAGVMTQAFVDKYPKTLRFVKKTIEELNPVKVDPNGEEPFPPGDYYLACCRMSLDETDLGLFEFVVPLALFDLAETPAAEPPPIPAEAAPNQAAAMPKSTAAAGEPPVPPETVVKKPKFTDAKKLVDVVFKTTISQIGEEIGALLGQTLKCDDLQLVMTSKKEFFSAHCLDKSILTDLKVTGDKTGIGYLATRIPDAIALGGTLIMLPEDQIASLMKADEFAGEVADAFGEIANILAGSLTQVFLDRYPTPLRFIKTDTRTLVPTKVDMTSDQPFAEGSYYLASFAVHMDGYQLHRFLLIFPAELFDLDAAEATARDSESTVQAAPQGAQAGAWGESPADRPAAATDTRGAQGLAATGIVPPTGTPLVLILSDQTGATEPFVEILSSASYECRVLNYQDDIRDLFQKHPILGIFLVMSQVGEKGFAAAIKLQSAGRPLPPLIFAGDQWTRSAVLRAVKYGAKDILVTPAGKEEIKDKVSLHFKKAG